MSTTKASPLNGAAKATAKDAPKTEATIKSLGMTRAESITRKIEAFKALDMKVRHRSAFQTTLDDVNDAAMDMSEENGENWDETNLFRVSLNIGDTSRKVVSFANVGIVKDFLEFIKERIEGRIEKIDEEILALDI